MKNKKETVKLISGSDDPLMESIISLGDKNKSTLGLLPKDAFRIIADKKNIIVAQEENRLLGYLLFSPAKSKRRVSIVHLCLDEVARGRGLGRALFKKLVEVVPDHFSRIRLKCRKDFDANSFWPKLGFVREKDVPGRGKDGKLLTIWTYSLGRATLFSEYEDFIQRESITATLDMNVLISIKQGDWGFLNGDWITEEVQYFRTREISNELSRSTNKKEQEEMKKAIAQFKEVVSGHKERESFFEDLKRIKSGDLSENDRSDLRHLAESLSGGMNFFITQDAGILKMSEAVELMWGLKILSPTEFILEVDEMTESNNYKPVLLSDKTLNKQRVGSQDFGRILDGFFDPNRDGRKNRFKTKCEILAETDSISGWTLKIGGDLVAVWIEEQNGNSLDVKIIRLKESRERGTIFSCIISTIVEDAEKKMTKRIRIPFSEIGESENEALIHLRFLRGEGFWIKYLGFGLLHSSALKIPEQIEGKGLSHIELERTFWPQKIRTREIPCFIVPIRTIWAQQLFDIEAARHSLFGSDRQLILGYQNAYYRSAKPKVLKPGARILWYVSKGRDKGDTYGKAIKGSSYIDEILIDKPKALFKKYKHLGIFKFGT